MRAERPSSDRPIALVVAFAFALSVGIATVAIPLLALAAGYGASGVGLLVAVASGSQLATRLNCKSLLDTRKSTGNRFQLFHPLDVALE